MWCNNNSIDGARNAPAAILGAMPGTVNRRC